MQALAGQRQGQRLRCRRRRPCWKQQRGCTQTGTARSCPGPSPSPCTPACLPRALTSRAAPESQGMPLLLGQSGQSTSVPQTHCPLPLPPQLRVVVPVARESSGCCLYRTATERQMFCRWEPEPGEVDRQGRRASKWDSRDSNLSVDAYAQDSLRDAGGHFGAYPADKTLQRMHHHCLLTPALPALRCMANA